MKSLRLGYEGGGGGGEKKSERISGVERVIVQPPEGGGMKCMYGIDCQGISSRWSIIELYQKRNHATQDNFLTPHHITFSIHKSPMPITYRFPAFPC